MQRVSEIASLSHDIRNMMASIVLSAEELESSKDPRTATIGRRIVSAAHACASMCATAIEMQNSKGWTHIEDEIHVAEVIGDVVSQLRSSRFRTVEILIECQPSLMARLCRARLYRIMFNLILNSCLALQNQLRGRVVVRARRRGSDLAIDIEDNGPGLPRHFADAVSSFGLLNQPPNNPMHGIGLPTAMTLARQLGGRLLLVDTGPNGTSFRLKLDCCALDQITVETGVTPSSPPDITSPVACAVS